MMMDNDFPLVGARTTDPRSPRDEFVPQEWQKKLFQRQPEAPKPEDQGPVKNAAGLGYLQEYVAGMNRYQQAGTDVPDFGVQTDYSQQAGGPLVAQGIPVGQDPNLPMDQDQFQDWVRGQMDKRNHQYIPSSPAMQERMRRIRGRYGFV